MAKTITHETGIKIDITPTWAGMVNVILALVENGDRDGRGLAIAELRRMAALADLYVEERKGVKP